MGDTRDPETDQPAPEPGGYPVQAVLIEALKQRMEFGLKKYGRPLETNNGRDPLRDMWEEMLDMVSYFTQFVLEQGVELPGLEKFTLKPEPDSWGSDDDPDGVARGIRRGGVAGLLDIPSLCPICNHEPHVPGSCRMDAPSGLTNCMCGSDLVRPVPEQSDPA